MSTLSEQLDVCKKLIAENNGRELFEYLVDKPELREQFGPKLLHSAIEHKANDALAGLLAYNDIMVNENYILKSYFLSNEPIVKNNGSAMHYAALCNNDAAIILMMSLRHKEEADPNLQNGYSEHPNTRIEIKNVTPLMLAASGFGATLAKHHKSFDKAVFAFKLMDNSLDSTTVKNSRGLNALDYASGVSEKLLGRESEVDPTIMEKVKKTQKQLEPLIAKSQSWQQEIPALTTQKTKEKSRIELAQQEETPRRRIEKDYDSNLQKLMDAKAKILQQHHGIQELPTQEASFRKALEAQEKKEFLKLESELATGINTIKAQQKILADKQKRQQEFFLQQKKDLQQKVNEGLELFLQKIISHYDRLSDQYHAACAFCKEQQPIISEMINHAEGDANAFDFKESLISHLSKNATQKFDGLMEKSTARKIVDLLKDILMIIIFPIGIYVATQNYKSNGNVFFSQQPSVMRSATESLTNHIENNRNR